MFLSAVILILQELLEAALLISMLLVLTSVLPKRWPGFFSMALGWVFSAVGVGLLGAWIYALLMPVVSTWFDYVGYEVLNGALQFVTIGFLLAFCYALNPGLAPARWHGRAVFAGISMIVAVAIGIVREGSEVILYVQGSIAQPENISPVMLGALMAAGIGTSSGLVLFHSLGQLPQQWTFRVAILLLGLFAGNMAAQAVQQLTQADWLPFTAQVWDSSALVAESDISGKLLYALVGYEANPSLLQLLAYLAALGLVACSPLFRSAWRSVPALEVR